MTPNPIPPEVLIFDTEKHYRTVMGTLASISPMALLCDATTLRKHALRTVHGAYRLTKLAQFAIPLPTALAQLKARREHLTLTRTR